jgi:hypothetical protein
LIAAEVIGSEEENLSWSVNAKEMNAGGPIAEQCVWSAGREEMERVARGCIENVSTVVIGRFGPRVNKWAGMEVTGGIHKMEASGRSEGQFTILRCEIVRCEETRNEKKKRRSGDYGNEQRGFEKFSHQDTVRTRGSFQ